MAEPGLAAEVGARFDHVLVDEYQDTNRLQATILRALKPDGRGLTVVGDDAQSIYSFRAATVRNILDFPQAVRAAGARRHAGAQLPLDAADPRRVQRGHRARARAPRQEPVDRAALDARSPQLVTVRDEADQARCVAERVLEHRETGIALKAQAVLFRTSSHSAQLELELAPAQHPVRQVRRAAGSSRRRTSRTCCRCCAGPRIRAAGSRAFASLQLLPGIGPATATRLLDAMAATAEPLAALSRVRRRRRPRRRLAGAWSRSFDALRRGTAAGRPSSTSSPLVRAAARAPLRRRAGARRRPRAAARDRGNLRHARALPDRADARSAGRDQRRGRRADAATRTT